MVRTFAKITIIPLLLALSVVSLLENMNTNVLASQSEQQQQEQSYCPPICLDEVRQHVDEAQEALEEGDFVAVQSELNIVDSLLDQLKYMTTTSD